MTIIALAHVVTPFALAGVRAFSDPRKFSNFIDHNPSALARELPRGGDFDLEGGVVFRGQARFHRETGGELSALQANSLKLSANNAGDVSIEHDGIRYRLEMHKGLACPLARFVARNGKIVYTIPERQDAAAEERMARLGLVDQTGSVGDTFTDMRLRSGAQKIAREFANTIFVKLLFFADFAETEPLPSELKNTLVSRLNAAVGTNRGEPTEQWQSYFNTDQQVTYQVYLVPGSRRVDAEGVPLRYYWNYGTDQSALISNVEALSQDWPAGASLTDFSDSNSEATQYDVVSLFQNAGIFRELRNADQAAFNRFVSAACAS